MDYIKNLKMTKNPLTLSGINDQVVSLIKTRSEITLTADELQYLLLVEYNNQQIRKKQYYAFYLSCPVPLVTNAKVVGIIAAAVVGIFLAPVLGVGLVAAALIGASIGWRLLGGAPDKPERKELRQSSVVSSPGFDSPPQPPQIGSVVPLLFTNTSSNPNGGLRVSGNVVNSYVKTFKNVQTLYTLLALGLGEIQEIDNSNLLIDNQSRDSFYEKSIITSHTLGLENQNTFPEYTKYSQAVSPGNNNTLGVSLRHKIQTGGLSGNQFNLENQEAYESLVAGENYILGSQEFKIINKFIDNGNYKAVADVVFTDSADGKVFAVYRFNHKTNQSCSEVDINFSFEISARDKETNEPTTFAVVFDLFVDVHLVGRFYITSQIEGTLRRAIKIYNLPYKKHTIKTASYASIDSSVPIYSLDDSGIVRTVSSGAVYEGKNILFEIESNPNSQHTISQINNFLNNDTKSSTSSDRGANGRVTTINYRVSTEDLGHESMTNYKNLALNNIIAEASAGLTSSPAYSTLVKAGIKYRNHIAAGQASIGSSQKNLVVNGVDISAVVGGYICRNISKQIESNIVDIVDGTIITNTSLFWQVGEDFLIYFEGAINYFPDIFVYSRLNRKGGVKGLRISEKFIDYPSICKARKFCKDNNYFFDAVIDTATNWNEWVSKESLASLLFPFKYAGNYGLKMEDNTPPTDIFNASRIIPGSYSQSKPPNIVINAVQLTYTENDDSTDNSFFKVDRTLTVMTQAAYYSIEPLQIDNLTYKSITNLEQAKAVASKYLKSRLLQNKVIEFKTGIYGFGCREGDLIIVQYALTETETELSGFCLSAQTLTNGEQEITLNKKASQTLNNQGYTASIYHLESGVVETSKYFFVQPSGSISISGLSEAILPPRESYNGDVVVINKDISEKIYRISAIKPENYEVQITAVNWDAAIHDDADLFYVN